MEVCGAAVIILHQSSLCNTVTQHSGPTTSRNAHGSRGFRPQLPGTTALGCDEEDHHGGEHGDSRAAHFVVAGKQRVRRDLGHGISFTGMLPIKKKPHSFQIASDYASMS